MGSTGSGASGGRAEPLSCSASKTSSRCTSTSRGALMPMRTCSPRTSSTVTTMSFPIMMLWFDRRVSTSTRPSFVGNEYRRNRADRVELAADRDVPLGAGTHAKRPTATALPSASLRFFAPAWRRCARGASSPSAATRRDGGDLAVRVAVGEQHEHLALPRGERRIRLDRPSSSWSSSRCGSIACSPATHRSHASASRRARSPRCERPSTSAGATSAPTSSGTRPIEQHDQPGRPGPAHAAGGRARRARHVGAAIRSRPRRRRPRASRPRRPNAVSSTEPWITGDADERRSGTAASSSTTRKRALLGGGVDSGTSASDLDRARVVTHIRPAGFFGIRGVGTGAERILSGSGARRQRRRSHPGWAARDSNPEPAG